MAAGGTPMLTDTASRPVRRTAASCIARNRLLGTIQTASRSGPTTSIRCTDRATSPVTGSAA